MIQLNTAIRIDTLGTHPLSSLFSCGRFFHLLLEFLVEGLPVRQRRVAKAPPGPHKKREETSKLLRLRKRGGSGRLGARRELELVLAGKYGLQLALPLKSLGRVILEVLISFTRSIRSVQIRLTRTTGENFMPFRSTWSWSPAFSSCGLVSGTEGVNVHLDHCLYCEKFIN